MHLFSRRIHAPGYSWAAPNGRLHCVSGIWIPLHIEAYSRPAYSCAFKVRDLGALGRWSETTHGDEELKSKVEVARDWQQTVSGIEATPLPASLPALVDRSAALYGDRIAWSFFERGEHVTFIEAQLLSSRAAGLLRKWGVRRGDKVAVMAENSPAYLVAWLALARLGAAIVPINTRYTSRELEHVLRLSQAKLLVVDIALLPVAEELLDRVDVIREGRVITVGGPPSTSDWATALASTESMEIDDTAANLDDVVNIQFTSGTTGFPKGC